MYEITIRDYIGRAKELIEKFSLKDAKEFAEGLKDD